MLFIAFGAICAGEDGGLLLVLQCHDSSGARVLLEKVQCIISLNLHLACTWNAGTIEPGMSELTFVFCRSVVTSLPSALLA